MIEVRMYTVCVFNIIEKKFGKCNLITSFDSMTCLFFFVCHKAFHFIHFMTKLFVFLCPRLYSLFPLPAHFISDLLSIAFPNVLLIHCVCVCSSDVSGAVQTALYSKC